MRYARRRNAGVAGIQTDLRKPSVPSLNLCAGLAVHLNSSSAFERVELIPKLMLHSGQPFIHSFVMGLYSAGWETGNFLVVVLIQR